MASNVPPHLLRSLNPEDALRAFVESTEEAAEAAQRSAQATGDDTREKRKATKASKDFVQRLSSSLPGTLAQATQAGIQSQFTGNNTTFGQGFTSSVVRGIAGATGAGSLQFSAIDRAAQRTQDFFSPAAEAGIDFTSPEAQAQVNRINQLFQDQEDRKIPLQRQVNDIRTARTNYAAGVALGEGVDAVGDQLVSLLIEIRDKIPRVGD